MLSPLDRARAQALSQIMEEWAKEIRRVNVRAVVEDGIEIPGYALRAREGREEITDVVEAQRRAFAESISLESFLQACTLSLPKLAEQFRATKGGTQAEARTQLTQKLQDLILQNETVTFLQKTTKGKKNADIVCKNTIS